jgi:hypothetical protein
MGRNPQRFRLAQAVTMACGPESHAIRGRDEARQGRVEPNRSNACDAAKFIRSIDQIGTAAKQVQPCP